MNGGTTVSKAKARGLLNEEESFKRFTLNFYQAPDVIEDVVSDVWHVQWNLPDGEIYQQSNLPHPVQHLVIDPQRESGFFGCSTGRFDYELSGTGAVLGLKLHPGAGRSLHNAPMWTLTDNRIELSAVFGAKIEHLEKKIANQSPVAPILSELHEIMAASAAKVSPAARDARHIVEWIENEKNVRRVSEVAAQAGLGIRKLQRLFANYIGVSPKWVIDRYRIFEALEALNKAEEVDLADLAARLEYTDQAHFGKQFKSLTGVSPGRYLNKKL